MLRITVPARELYDERNNLFIQVKEHTLQLEHSLVSMSKWESKWCKPFLSTTERTYEETVDYIRCMTLTQNVDPFVYSVLTNGNIEDINRYIDAPMTATTVVDEEGKSNTGELVTAELIYYWMIALNIPFECQKWHLNRLLMLIRVCNAKNKPTKKMSPRDTARSYKELNAARRKKLKTRG